MTSSRKFGAMLALSITPFLMAFDSHNTWDDLEGEWAYGSVAACDHNILSFTNDYKRDRYGAVEYPLESGAPRRVRLATVFADGEPGRRITVGRRLNIENGPEGSVLHIRVRRPASSPFRGWSQMYFSIVDDDTLQVMPESSEGEGDGLWLIHDMGGMPATLVRCP